MRKKKHRTITPEEGRWQCPLDVFQWQSTEEIPKISGLINQQRATQALSTAVHLQQPGFNVYVSGPSGTGRRSLVMEFLKKIAEEKPTPRDWCYVHNFADPSQPTALSFPPGKGKQFRDAMNRFSQLLRSEFPQLFQRSEVQSRIDEIYREKNQLETQQFEALEKKALEHGFLLKAGKTGISLTPLLGQKVMSPEEYQQLSPKEKEELKLREEQVHQEILNFLAQIREISQQTEEKIKKFKINVAKSVLQTLMSEVRKFEEDCPKLTEYLSGVEQYVLSHLEDFITQAGQTSPLPLPPGFAPPQDVELKVNLLVDNSQQKGAPIIFEPNPTFYNLFGRLEKKQFMGALLSDFTMIRPGCLHRANGGFLVLYARDLLIQPGAYEGLKRAIRFQKIYIEDLGESLGLLALSGIRPEPIPLDVKIIMIGPYWIYYLLSLYDEDFHRVFKIRADFDLEMENSPKHLQSLVHFVNVAAREHNLLPFNATALAEIAEYLSRSAESQKKFSTRFGELLDILREASYIAESWGEKTVGGHHIKKTIEEKIYRSNLVEEKVYEMIKDGQIVLDITGKKTGQVNGLSFVQLGDYQFGRPVRITAQTYLGRAGIIDIERESHLSGPIHQKAVMILSGYLHGTFGQKFPITLSATLVFEQSYSPVEGDSASAAELCCILSSLADVPLRQDIAITGSVDQMGRIQPVGGVNEKIEGFFRCAKYLGLTGQQGVIIPESNLQNLMLSDEVVDAIREKKFHIYPVKTIEECMEILTDMPVGKPDKRGNYPPNTVFGKVQKKLYQFYRRMRETTPGEKQKKKKRKKGS
ncbi:MAG: Lon protease family protein [bacterium JZ-2024 1]